MKSGRFYLRNATFEDLSMILKWRNKTEVRNMMFNSNIIEMDEHVKWFKKVNMSGSSAETKIFFYDGIPYGVVNIYEIDSNNGTCRWSFYIGEEGAPAGLGKVLSFFAINYIFNDLKLQKLYAEVIEYNKKSYFLHKKLGFKQEGFLEAQKIKDGESINVYLFGLLKSSWHIRFKEINEIIKRDFML